MARITPEEGWQAALGFDEPQVPPEPDTTAEAVFNSTEVEKAARESLDFLAALAMPTIFRYFFPDIYKAIWNWLISYIHRTRDFSQLALGLPRGFAKTTFVKIFLLYVILFTKRQFIAICAHSVPKSVAILSDVIDFLDEPNIKAVFGDWRLGMETDQQVLKKFGFRGRNIILWAGTIETLRGVNLKHQRPDVMLFDDIQSRQDADSQVVSTQLETDLYATAMKAKSPHGCLFIFVGNMYPTKWSLLRRLKANSNWLKFIVGGILESGKSLWEELQPLTQLLKEFENDLKQGRPEIFYAEVLNDENASINNLVDFEKLPTYKLQDSDIHQGNFVIIDPSGDKVGSDAVTITYNELFDGIPVCKEIDEGRYSPGDTIIHALNLCLKHNCRVVAIESNAYQYSLHYWFDFIRTQRGISGIESVEVYSGSVSKNSRIMAMFKQLLSGEIILHPSVQALVKLQVSQWNPLKRENTDGILDCLTYMTKVVEEYGHLLLAGTIIEMQEFGNIPVREEWENACF